MRSANSLDVIGKVAGGGRLFTLVDVFSLDDLVILVVAFLGALWRHWRRNLKKNRFIDYWKSTKNHLEYAVELFVVDLIFINTFVSRNSWLEPMSPENLRADVRCSHLAGHSRTFDDT